MRTVSMHEAKTHLSSLVEQAAKGEPFAIAKAGKPLVKVVALDASSAGQVKRIEFMEGQILVPHDFDRMGRAEIARLSGYDSARYCCWTRICCSGRPDGPINCPPRPTVCLTTHTTNYCSVARIFGRSLSKADSAGMTSRSTQGCCDVRCSAMATG